MLLLYIDTPVYAAVGNHESAPVNSYPPSSIYNEPGADIQWLYQTLYDSWSHWIPTDDLGTVLKGESTVLINYKVPTFNDLESGFVFNRRILHNSSPNRSSGGFVKYKLLQ